MYRKGKVVWSLVEIEYLKKNRDKSSLNQLSLNLAKSRAAIKRKCDELDGKSIPLKKLGPKIGRRKDLGLSVRSGWEANILRWFTYRRIKWEYEPKSFYFEEIKHGTVSYTPDVWLSNKKEWIEIKGYLLPSDRTRIRRFLKYYPKEFAKLKAIVGSKNTKAAQFFESLEIPIIAYYNELAKKYKDKIKHWE